MALFEMLVGAAAAIILFLYGIENLSLEIQRIAGERLRGLLARVMANRWIGAAISAFITSVIQSSTATTVIAVGLVSAGLITFSQSLGIIAGANIGTTITAQLVAFNLLGIAPFFMVFGFLFSMAGGKYRFFGKPIFYFGLVFFSMMLLSEVFTPLKGDPQIEGFLVRLDNPFIALLAGIAITALVQSSSVTTGIVVLLGMKGLIGLGAAIPMIMGANIGTTTTAMLAAHRLDAFARRTALAHLIFNFMGVLMFLPFLNSFEVFVHGLGGDTAHQIANAHLIFNFTTAFVFLLLAGTVANVVSRLVKTDRKELVFKPKFINGKMPESNSDAVALVLMEMKHELELARELFLLSLNMVKEGRVHELQRTAKLESLTDFLNEKISEYLGTFSRRKLSEKEAHHVAVLARMSNEIEQLADLGENISRTANRMEEKGMKLLPQSNAEVSAADSIFLQNLDILAGNMEIFHPNDLARMKRNSAKLSRVIGKSYLSHIKRLVAEKPGNYAGTSFTDVISALEAANSKVVSLMEHRKFLHMQIKRAYALGHDIQ